MATKTQVTTEAFVVAGKLSFYRQRRHPGPSAEAQSERLSIEAANVLLAVEQQAVEIGPVLTCPNHPAYAAEYDVWFARWIETLGVAGGIVDSEGSGFGWIDVGGGGDDDGETHELQTSFSIAVGPSRLWRTETLSYGTGRDGRPVFADDVAYSDEWIDENPCDYAFTLGNLSYSGTQAWDEGFELWLPEVNRPTTLKFVFQQWRGTNEGVYLAVEDLTFGGKPVDFSRYYYGTTMPTGPVYINGIEGGWELEANMSEQSPVWEHEIDYEVGLILDFSQFSIVDRGGALLGDLRVSGNFTASNHAPESLAWSTTP